MEDINEELKCYYDDVNNFIDKISSQFNNFKYDGLHCLKIEDVKFRVDKNEKYNYIKNYFRYILFVKKTYINKKSQYYFSKDDYEIFSNLSDFDKYDKIIDILKKEFKVSDKYNVKYLKDRYFLVNGLPFETDTAISFRSLFLQFIRNYKNEEMNGYLEKEEKPDEKKLNAYLLMNIDKFDFTDEQEEIMNLFEELAQKYHTSNNVVLVPYKYNCKRYLLFKDIYPLSIKYLIQLGCNKDLIYKTGKIESMDCNLDEDFYKNVKNKIGVPKDSNQKNLQLEDFKTYLKLAIHYIDTHEWISKDEGVIYEKNN